MLGGFEKLNDDAYSVTCRQYTSFEGEHFCKHFGREIPLLREKNEDKNNDDQGRLLKQIIKAVIKSGEHVEQLPSLLETKMKISWNPKGMQNQCTLQQLDK